MKKFLFILVILAVVAPVSAARHLTGDWEGWTGAGPIMTDNLDGTFSATVGGFAAGERHEFKVTDGSWGWAQPGSGNSWFFADAAGNIDITFNENVVADGWVGEQYRMGLSTDPGAWSIVGSLNGWVNNDPLWATTPQGGGIYKLTQSLMAGSYDWKAVVTGSWDAISSERSVNADNLNLTLAVDSDVDFYVDALTGTVKAEIIPEPATMALLGLGALLIRRKK